MTPDPIFHTAPSAVGNELSIMSPTDAKRFLAGRVIDQALAELCPFSQNEQWMLRFSESDPEFDLDLARLRELEAEIDEAAYEAKVAGLLQRAYERDMQTHNTAGARYREAALILARQDHYLSVIVERALPVMTDVRPAPAAGRAWALDRIRLVLTAVTLLCAVGAAGWTLSAYLGRILTSDEILVYAWGAMLSGAMVYTLLRLAFGATAVDAVVDRVVRSIAGSPES